MARVSIPTDGAAIKHHRQMAGWNSTPFAKKVGITVGYLSRLESGDRNASPAVLQRIAKALKVPMTALVKKPPTALAA